MTSLLKHRFFIPLLIFVVALFLRTYHLESTLTFLEDEGRDVLIGYRMLDTLRPVLLGPQTSTGDMYLGPFYYYFITPALAISGLSPLGPAVLIAITGALTSVLLYVFGKKYFGTLAGIFASLLYTILPLPVVFTRNSWNPNLAPLVSLTMISLVVSLIVNPNTRRWRYFALGALASILMQLHYMTLLFLGGVGLTFLLFRARQIAELLKGAVLALAGFVLLLSPFILFEFRNDFVNTRAITRFVEADEVHNIRYTMPLSLWADKVGSTTTRLFSSLYGRDALTPDPHRLTITLFATLSLTLLLIVTWKNHTPRVKILRILSVLFLIPLLALGIYQENIHLHYLGFMFPLVYLLFSAGIMLPRLRYLYLILFAISIFYATPQLLRYLNSSGTNQLIRAREVASYISTNSAGEPYNLVSSPTTNTTPYQYYAAILGNPPTTALQKTVYLVCQGHECSSDDVNSPFLFITGPAHPTLEAYLGHPLYHTFDRPRRVVSNEHVSHGVWVAKLLLE